MREVRRPLGSLLHVFGRREPDVCGSTLSQEAVDHYGLIRYTPVHGVQIQDRSIQVRYEIYTLRTLILKRAALFSFHQARHSVTLCPKSACSIFRHWLNTSTSTRSYSSQRDRIGVGLTSICLRCASSMLDSLIPLRSM